MKKQTETKTNKRGPKKGTKYHTEFEQAAGVILLAKNNNDYDLTAKILGVTPETISNWEKQSLAKKEALPVMLENTIKRLLEMMPTEWTGNSWAIAMGILLDKWLLVNGQPTQRMETKNQNVSANITAMLENIPEDKKDDVRAAAEQIIRDAISSSNNNQSS